MESGMRLRLVFRGSKILSYSQRTEGLKHAWVSVNQSLETISRASRLLCQWPCSLCKSLFSLQTIPKMNVQEFVLPPFESISILNKEDVICVKRKGSVTDFARPCDVRKAFELERAAAAKQLANGGMKLLANEEFENETGGYQSKSEEEAEPEKLEDVEDTPKKTISKKRKATKKLNRSKDRKKRKKSATTEEALGTPENVQSKIQPEQNGDSHQHDDIADSSNSDIDERTKNVDISTPNEKKSDQIQENGKSNGISSPVSNGSKKLPSRSSRRKKLKRQFLRKQRENEMQVLNKTDNQKSSGKDKGKSIIQHQQSDESNDEEGDVVPVVVKPGHIRFEPLSKVDASQTIQQPETPVENFQWNGITNKRKGQKWGKEKTGSYKRSDQQNLNGESSTIPAVEEGPSLNAPIEFDKLTPCITLPQVGDIVAYRLIELSSSWTPELSSFRVGKISKLDPTSDVITLLQVPEHPIVFEKVGEEVEESAAKSNMSLYANDGSLEIDYSSLADVRVVKHGNARATKSVSCIISRATTADQGASSSWSPWPNEEPKSKKRSTAAQANGKENAWDEICDTLSAKKSQPTPEENWTKKASTSQPQSSWSNRGLRGSAIGPTMARLRAQKEI